MVLVLFLLSFDILFIAEYREGDDPNSDFTSLTGEQSGQEPTGFTDNMNGQIWAPTPVGSPKVFAEDTQKNPDTPPIEFSKTEDNEEEKSYLGKIESSLLVKLKNTDSVTLLITAYDMSEVWELLGIRNTLGAYAKKKYETRLDTAIVELPSYMVPQIASLKNVINVQSYRLYEPPIFPEDGEGLDFGREVDPAMWNAVKYHGADGAWSMGYNGTGIKVAVIDTGVDFGLRI